MEGQFTSRFSPAMGEFSDEEFVEVKKGPWTEEEDALLVNYVNIHGEGRWNYVARCAGLKRTGKSCRLRWLNYLRPELRRGNITLEEQLLILELHSRYGNRWSKIAQYLPGRTDNEIKNYWRTRVQKQAKQMKCDVNSKQFRDAMQHVWMPRLREKIRSSSTNSSSIEPTRTATYLNIDPPSIIIPNDKLSVYQPVQSGCSSHVDPSPGSETWPATSSESYSDVTTQASVVSDVSCMESTITDGPWTQPDNWPDYAVPGPMGYNETDYWLGEVDLMMENMWSEENIWFLQQQLFDN